MSRLGPDIDLDLVSIELRFARAVEAPSCRSASDCANDGRFSTFRAESERPAISLSCGLEVTESAVDPAAGGADGAAPPTWNLSDSRFALLDSWSAAFPGATLTPT